MPIMHKQIRPSSHCTVWIFLFRDLLSLPDKFGAIDARIFLLPFIIDNKTSLEPQIRAIISTSPSRLALKFSQHRTQAFASSYRKYCTYRWKLWRVSGLEQIMRATRTRVNMDNFAAQDRCSLLLNPTGTFRWHKPIQVNIISTHKQAHIHDSGCRRVCVCTVLSHVLLRRRRLLPT